MSQVKKNIAIRELEKYLNPNNESKILSKFGIEIIKDAIAILEGRNRESNLQFQDAS